MFSRRQFPPSSEAAAVPPLLLSPARNHSFKSVQELILDVVDATSGGGTLLLNVRPQPDGLTQSEFQKRLRSVDDSPLPVKSVGEYISHPA